MEVSDNTQQPATQGPFPPRTQECGSKGTHEGSRQVEPGKSNTEPFLYTETRLQRETVALSGSPCQENVSFLLHTLLYYPFTKHACTPF